MTQPSPPHAIVCPECGATVVRRATNTVMRCWLCGHRVGLPAGESANFAVRPTAPQFGIASMMLTVTLVAVCLGVGVMAPGLGVALAVLVTPALIRTAIGVERHKEVSGRTMDVGQKIAAFAGSLGVVTMIGTAAGAAFFATCWAGFFGGTAIGQAAGARDYDPLAWGFFTGIGLGVIAGIFAAYFVIRWLWPHKE